jgi:hypothetical protein
MTPKDPDPCYSTSAQVRDPLWPELPPLWCTMLPQMLKLHHHCRLCYYHYPIQCSVLVENTDNARQDNYE